MSWKYVQLSGEMVLEGASLAFSGYSGFGLGKNNPTDERVEGIGPIPCGGWLIAGPPEDTAEHGPYVLRLEARPGTNTYGRTGFLIHGDSVEAPGAASRGCIVLPHWAREAIWASGIRKLLVVSMPLTPKESA